MKSGPLTILILLAAFALLVTGLLSINLANKELDKSVNVDKIVILKSKRVLQLWHGNRLIKSYKIALGRNPCGPKQFEGDNRTPEGLYYINDKNPHSRFHKNLGISYPNEQDIRNARKKGKKPGGQIKIHGLGNGHGWIGSLHRLVDWTRGCIAVTNKEIDELYRIIKIGTPVEIKP